MPKLKKTDKVRVQMLTSMAGMDFSIAYGEIVELDPEIAAAWIEAEIAKLVEGDE